MKSGRREAGAARLVPRKTTAIEQQDILHAGGRQRDCRRRAGGSRSNDENLACHRWHSPALTVAAQRCKRSCAMRLRALFARRQRRYKGERTQRTEASVDSLEKRIDRLERGARIHQIIIAALALAVVGAIALERRHARTTEIETAQLSIV